MKATHIIIAICTALGAFAAGRLSLPHAPQTESHPVFSHSATTSSHLTQSAVVQNGNHTLRVEGTAALVPSQSTSTPPRHP